MTENGTIRQHGYSFVMTLSAT